MIKQETLENGLIHTFSDAGKRLLQVETGEIYEDAIDVDERYHYEETEEEPE